MLWTLFIGLLVGLVAKLIMPGRDPGGWIITMLLGVAGAFVANFIGKNLGWYRDVEFAGFLASVFGAVLILIIYRLVVDKKRL